MFRGLGNRKLCLSMCDHKHVCACVCTDTHTHTHAHSLSLSLSLSLTHSLTHTHTYTHICNTDAAGGTFSRVADCQKYCSGESMTRAFPNPVIAVTFSRQCWESLWNSPYLIHWPMQTIFNGSLLNSDGPDAVNYNQFAAHTVTGTFECSSEEVLYVSKKPCSSGRKTSKLELG